MAQFDPQEFVCTGPIDTNIRVGAGLLTVATSPDPVAVVTVTPYDDNEASQVAAANTKVQFDDGRLRIETPDSHGGWIFKRNGRVRVDVRLPDDSRLRSHTGSADVRVEGQLRDADIHTGSGDTFISRTTGDLTVRSGSGDVHGEEIGGELRVSTGSGDLRVTRVTGAITAETASGDVSIDDAHATVRASTASGDVQIGAARGGDVRVNSASGDVAVGVPAGTGVWLDLNTVSGSTNSNLDMSAAPGESGAKLTLHVQTVSGDITVRRVALAG